MKLEDELKKVKGRAGIYYKNLTTGEVIGHNENLLFKPASIIKLPTFMAIHKMVAEGRLSFDEKIKVRYEDRVPSCGAFNAFSDEPIVDIGTLCFLMIVISDNTATNILFKHIGIENLNEEFKSMGLVDTHIERCLFDDEGQKAGLENKIVPSEIAFLLEKVYNKSFVNEEVSQKILDVLLEQQSRWKIPAYIEHLCPVANKTGESDDITGDAAIVLGDNPFILVCIFNETFVPDTDEWIRHYAKHLFEKRDLVCLSNEDFLIDLRYATEHNFTGRKIYDSNNCWLNYHTAKRLTEAKKIFEKDGYRIKVWDAYRPISAQWKFWEIVHDDNYVANPENISKNPPYRPTHMNGLCVDITLTDLNGNEIFMPTEFDDMTEKASLNYIDIPEEARKNAEYMRSVMESVGFTGYKGEWWHFYDVTTEPVACFDFLI